MDIEAAYPKFEKKYPTFDKASPGTVAWIAAYSADENVFPDCELVLAMRTNIGGVRLDYGFVLNETTVERSKYILANVKIVDC